MNDPVNLPAAFDVRAESNAFLKRVKKRAATKFAFTKSTSMRDAEDVAFWLFVFRRNDEALEVCRFLSTYEFAGRFDLWNSVETSLALESRLLRAAGKKGAAKKCVDRIRAVGVLPMRLKGGLLIGEGGTAGSLDQVGYCIAENRLADAREWRLMALKELCVMIELGGSKKWPIARAEKEFQSQLDILRSTVKVANE